MNEKKLNGWNNNLTPFEGVGGKPGYHEKIATMTPEQQKAKEILIKYISIIGSECEHDSYCDRPECNKLGYIFCHVDFAKAKECAIEEVSEILKILSGLLGNIVVTTGQSCEDTQKLIEFYKGVKQEIEKL